MTTTTDPDQADAPPGGEGSGAEEPVPPATLAALQERFSSRRVTYISHVLTTAELSVIADLGDALLIARIKRMPRRRLDRFEKLIPAEGDHRLFHTLQMQWLKDEQYLLGTRLGRTPTHKELLIDFMASNNGLRFRAFFSMKYPGRVRHARTDQRPRTGAQPPPPQT
jgi:hypothetical protein